MGSILLTGANGSLAIPAVLKFLSDYPQFTYILTVRDVSDKDANTNRLRATIAQVPNAKVSIRQLDLAALPQVRSFASTVADEIAQGKLPPLAAIVCNAYYWNLTEPLQTTSDGFEKSIAVSHLSHVAIVLRLLGSFGPEAGRIILFSSDAHEHGKNQLEKYPPVIPEDIDQLVKPAPDKPVDNMGQGFKRYAVSKLAVVMWAYALNRHLESDPALGRITAVAVNPGNLNDSRALSTRAPKFLSYMSKVLKPLSPLLRLKDPTMRSSQAAAADVVALATNSAFAGERGYFTMLKKDQSSADSQNQEKQELLWRKSAEWAGITQDETSLKL